MSKLPNWLTHDYKVNFSYKSLALAIVFIVLPNLFFLLGAYFIGLARPLINLDYLLACVLFALPNRYIRILGVLWFVGAVLIDVLMLAMQLFPFLDIAAIISLAPFLIDAPIRYMMLLVMVLAYLCVAPLLLIKIGGRWFKGKYAWLYVLLVGIGVYGLHHEFYEARYSDDRQAERFGQSDYFYIHSQYQRYLWVFDSGFIVHFDSIPSIILQDIAYISHHFGVSKSGIKEPVARPLVKSMEQAPVLGNSGVDLPSNTVPVLSDKMLLVVAESWGVARDPKVAKDILSAIYDRSDKLSFLDTGYFAFSGATVEGELRELCQADVEGGYAFSRLNADALKDCLPNHLKHQGYHTIGMHAGFSSIYERDYLYPKMGFVETVFAGDVNERKHCTPFNGVCDNELFDVVGDSFAKHGKLFYYWLTLTSHSPYAKKDIIDDDRFRCEIYNISIKDICQNYKLHAQFFDGLGELLDRPEMKGVEVIVVGDHMPPIISKEPVHPHIQWQDVSWVHLKVKP